MMYNCVSFDSFDYNELNIFKSIKKREHNIYNSYSTAIMMLDTETSKQEPNTTYKVKNRIKYNSVVNYVVAWSLSIRYQHNNICTLYGRKPSEIISTIAQIKSHLHCDKFYLFVHNLSYDWVFIRKFFISAFGDPVKQLNTKPHYPITIEFKNGLVLRDSLILSQRSLERWANDMNVEHKKFVGGWDYDVIRHQNTSLNNDEIKYIEQDTLAGVECIDALMQLEHKNIANLPLTATGFVRREILKKARKNDGHQRFKKQALTQTQQYIAEYCYHGGYTHANRHLVDYTIKDIVKCKDFTSSYPYTLLSEKYPMEKFTKIEDTNNVDLLLDKSDMYAFMFEFRARGIKLKDYKFPMPIIQYSKLLKSVNAVQDNGRIIEADFVSMRITEIDLKLIKRYYEWDEVRLVDIYFAHKRYLPRWLTDYVFELFEAKTKLKKGDKVLYNISKGKINSVYGVHVQKPVKDDIIEDYQTGEHNSIHHDITSYAEKYQKYIDNFNTVLPFQWGVWVTAYALYNLFDLGACAETWVYSDTDSCYGINWNDDAVKAYNDNCKKKLIDNGYGAVVIDDKEYWLGVATDDGDDDTYTEFRVMGSKRYCGRCLGDNKIHITVAGVPKLKGAECLNDNIENFTKGFIFSGLETGKKTHLFVFTDKITYNQYGDEIGDYIDLTPCDYELDGINNKFNFEEYGNEELEVLIYG